MQQVTLNVSDEYKALGDALNGLISDIKAKKTAVQDLQDLLAPLLGAVAGLQNLGADVKLVDNQVYLIRSIASALEPAPAPAAAP